MLLLKVETVHKIGQAVLINAVSVYFCDPIYCNCIAASSS